MRKILTRSVLFLFVTISLFSGVQDSTRIMVAGWNLENLFDTVDDPLVKDEEFTPEGSKNWTDDRLAVKLEHLSEIIKNMNSGNGPDFLSVEEVENQGIVEKLVEKCKSFRNYGIAYSESEDARGIDVGLLFDKNEFSLLKVVPHTVDIPFKTRPVLEVSILTKDADTLYFFINHWPSRRGGQKESEVYRIAASNTLATAIEQRMKTNPEVKIFAMGDFNDEPADESIKNLITLFNDRENKLVNLALPLDEKNEGSYCYRGEWNMIDQMIVSESCIKGKMKYISNSFQVIKQEQMITKSGNYKDNPMPTYGGSKYLGGYSDHFPIGAYFILTK